MSDRPLGRRAGELVAAAAVVAAVAAFAWRVGPDLSVTVQSAVFALVATLALAGAAATRFRQGLLFLFGTLAVGAVGYGASTHPLGTVRSLAAVLATLAVVFGALYVVEERRYGLRRWEALAVVVVVVAAGGALVAADLGTSPLSYETTVDDSATIPDDTEGNVPVVVGTATVENGFVYREQIRFPAARACIFNGTARTNVAVLYEQGGSYFPRSVGGDERLRANMTLLTTPSVAGSLNRTVPVERADTCPEESERERIVVVFDG